MEVPANDPPALAAELSLNSMVDRALETAVGGKIDSKTAWTIPLLTLLSSVVDRVEDPGSFAKAAGLLGTGAELYGKKVDFLHTTIQEITLKRTPAQSADQAGADPHIAPDCASMVVADESDTDIHCTARERHWQHIHHMHVFCAAENNYARVYMTCYVHACRCHGICMQSVTTNKCHGCLHTHIHTHLQCNAPQCNMLRRSHCAHAFTHLHTPSFKRIDAGEPDAGNDTQHSKKRNKKAAAHPNDTLVDAEENHRPTSDLAFAIDPLFHHVSANFDEGKASGLLLNNLSFYGGCNIHFSSCGVPHDLVAQGTAAHVPVMAAQDMAWTRSHARSIAERGAQTALLPTLTEMDGAAGSTPEAAEDLLNSIDEHGRRILQCIGVCFIPIANVACHACMHGMHAH